MGATKKGNACSVLKPLPPTYHPAQAATIVCNDSPCGAIPLCSIDALRKPSPCQLPARTSKRPPFASHSSPSISVTISLPAAWMPQSLRDGGYCIISPCSRHTLRPFHASFRASCCNSVRARWYAVYLTMVGGECSWLVSECFSKTNFVLHREIVPEIRGTELAY